ncbi:MAG: hypothetical protein V4587_16490 [Acidobacteriota bacterium]
MNAILTEIVNRLADVAASLDAMEASLIANRGLAQSDVESRFASRKATVESHLAPLRAAIATLP